MNDCWVNIDRKVYNVTKLLKEHPGGSRVLLDAAGTGQDAKDIFEGQQHS
jgi:cytochrome b involved in lipid metabolism